MFCTIVIRPKLTRIPSKTAGTLWSGSRERVPGIGPLLAYVQQTYGLVEGVCGSKSCRNLNDGGSMDMHLVQLLLPLHDNDQKRFPASHFDEITQDLSERFGGVTSFVRSPAIGLWKEDAGEMNSDDIAVFEVLAPQLDKDWWANYRRKLQDIFRQDEILIWAAQVIKL